jgi:hypothetical protein
MKTGLNMLAGSVVLLMSLVVVIKWQSPDDPAVEPVGIRLTSSERAGSSALSRAHSPPSRPHTSLRIGEPTIDNSAVADEAIAPAKEAAIEMIQDAATTYDPAQLAVIRPYLTSVDPELRAAAVDAMIVLGDASAGAMLRLAAAGNPSGEEAAAMMKAADYVELPPANLKMLAQKSRGLQPLDSPSRRKKK